MSLPPTDSYDRWHERRAASLAGASPVASASWHAMARRQLGDLRGLDVLEIGCGNGAFARELVERGAVLVAADFSPSAVAQARAEVPATCEVMIADVQDLPFPSGRFDLVVSLETLEHVPFPERGLAELVRVTRPGGRLIITTPNYLSLMGLWRVALRLVGRRYAELGQPINQPLMLFRRVLSLRRLGCRVDAVDGCVHSLPVPGFKTLTLRWLERPHRITKWFARHGLTAATRL